MIASSDSLALEGEGQKHMEELPHRILTHFLFMSLGFFANLQSAAEDSDPVQPVVE